MKDDLQHNIDIHNAVLRPLSDDALILVALAEIVSALDGSSKPLVPEGLRQALTERLNNRVRREWT